MAGAGTGGSPDAGRLVGRFWPIEHTADVALAAEAPDLGGLFDRCAAGMFSLIAEGPPVAASVEHEVTAAGADPAELLVDFLRELLWLHHSAGFLYAGAAFAELTGTALRARVRGERADPARHELLREIKAVTHHGLRVEPCPGGFRGQVVFDV